MPIGFQLISKGERYNDDKRDAFNEQDQIDISYVETYKLECATPQDSLAKSYENQNDLTITLEIPKSDYNNPGIQNILQWADLPVQHDDFYRDLAVNVTMADDDHTVFLSHARITVTTEDVTRSDFVTVTVNATQREDTPHGVVIANGWDNALALASANLANPPSMNVVSAVPLVLATPTNGAASANTQASNNIMVFIDIHPDNRRDEVFRSNVTYTNDARVFTVVQNGITRTRNHMLSQGYRWEREEVVMMDRTLFPSLRAPIESHEIIYFVRVVVRLVVSAERLSDVVAYMVGDRSFAINPTTFFSDLEIPTASVRNETSRYTVTIESATSPIHIPKAVEQGITLDNVPIREVRDRLAVLQHFDFEWIASSRTARFTKRTTGTISVVYLSGESRTFDVFEHEDRIYIENPTDLLVALGIDRSNISNNSMRYTITVGGRQINIDRMLGSQTNRLDALWLDGAGGIVDRLGDLIDFEFNSLRTHFHGLGRFEEVKRSGYYFDVERRVHTYTTNTSRERVAVSLGVHRGRTESFMSIVNAHNPIAMINAGFFGSESVGFLYNRDTEPLRHEEINIHEEWRNAAQRAGAVDDYNNFRVLFYYEDGKSEIYNYSQLASDRGVSNGIVEDKVKDRSLLFIISGTHHVSRGRALGRSMIGVREDGTIILMAAESSDSTSIEQAMRAMNVANYLMLDGSASTNFYYNGLHIRGHGWSGGPEVRDIGSVIQVHAK